MYWRILLISFLYLHNAYAQIPNGSFESWNDGSPDWWQTTNIPIVPAAVNVDSNSHSGFLAAKGIVVSDNHNNPFQPYLGIYGPAAQGFPILKSFNVASGWCKLFLNPQDYFTGFVRMYDVNQEPVGEGSIVIDSSISSWTEFYIHINYFSTGIPVSSSLFFTITDSTLLGSGHIGSYFLLDDLLLVEVVGISSFSDEVDISIIQSPALNELYIKSSQPLTNANYTIADISGREVMKKSKINSDETILLTNLSAGIYFFILNANDKKIVKKILLE